MTEICISKTRLQTFACNLVFSYEIKDVYNRIHISPGKLLRNFTFLAQNFAVGA